MKATTLGLSALLLTAACTDELADRTAETGRAIAFTPAAETRAAVDNADGMTDGFKVWGWYGTAYESTDKNVFDGVPVTKGTDGWGYNGTQYWIPGMKYNFYGVYPANVGECTDKGIITVSNFDCSKTGNAAVDLMIATAQGDGDSPSPVAMQFKHQLSKVAVIVQAAQGVTEATVSNVKLYGIDLQGTLSHQNNKSTWMNITDEERTTDKDTPFTVESGIVRPETKLTLFNDLLLIPQLTDKVQISFELKREGESTPTPVVGNLNSAGSWRAGNAYRYVITIEADVISFGGFTVENWETSSSEGNINIQ